ncbi:MAG: hypothetical protein ACO1OB_30440 [Archangium sp.]
MNTVYICIPSSTLGGAEKRFTGLWRFLRQHRGLDARLVTQRPLYELLQKVEEFRPLPTEAELYDLQPGESQRQGLRRAISVLHRSNPSAVFHFVMATPLEVQRFASRRTVFSEAMASLSLFNWKGRLASRLAAATAGRVDALEEEVLADYRRFFPFRRRAMSNTPNSYVDLEYYRPAPQQRNRLTFVGLFSETKQAFRLARAVPTIDKALRAAGIENPEFRFLGRETVSPGIRELFASYAGVDAKAAFVADPLPTLAESKVIFGIQTVTNYPSKALLEGMAAGGLPVVTDVGKTRRIVTPEFGEFVPRDFSADEMAAACVRAMTNSEAQRQRKVEVMRAFLRENFSIDTMADYYVGLYRQLQERR